MSEKITVSDEAFKLIEQVKKEKGFETVPETVDFMGGMFASRYRAIRKYAEKNKAAPKAKKAKPAKAAKAKAPKSEKAKVARKAKVAAQA